ncbi:uncharacterized protein V1516DRAFT_694762 [Lipomyces oligophaga]|uniref:uncharacterized protein n=1 Tax=Lipomyces oligophaga TaxID=45792 RepID=UPI0034CF4BD3
MFVAGEPTSPVLPPHTVRIKRKRNQDPLQALILGRNENSKRNRTDSYVFKLANTEEQPRHAGSVTLLETFDVTEPTGDTSSIKTSDLKTDTTRNASSLLRVAQDLLNPARLFRFPTRKRRASNEATEAKRSKHNETPQVTSNSTAKTISPPPVIREQPSVGQGAARRISGGIPAVKVISGNVTSARTIAEAKSPIRLQQRRRRSSSTSMSLSPTTSYQPISNEDELQDMVDMYLQLNPAEKKESADMTTKKALKRPHEARTVRTAENSKDVQQQTRGLEEDGTELGSGTATPVAKIRHRTGLDSVGLPKQEQRNRQQQSHGTQNSGSAVLEDKNIGGLSQRFTKGNDRNAAEYDDEAEDYVYDVYYREKYLGVKWEGGQYGLL